MKPTKQHIQDHALKLYNQNGYVNVRLQHIADAAFVSVGHLAYHFKTKDNITSAIYDNLVVQQEKLLKEFCIVPLFEDVQRYITAVYTLQQQYIFFYLDMLEIFRAYPGIGEKHRRHVDWRQKQLMYMMDFNISRGAFQPVVEEQKKMLLNQLSAHLDAWRYVVKIQFYSEDSLGMFSGVFWNLLKPCFSDMGQKEFEQLTASLQAARKI